MPFLMGNFGTDLLNTKSSAHKIGMQRRRVLTAAMEDAAACSAVAPVHSNLVS